MEGSKDSIKGRSTSVDTAVPDRPLLARLTGKDKQTIQDLYKTCPQLWDDFSKVIEFLDLLEKDARAYRTLYLSLKKVKDVTGGKSFDFFKIRNVSVFSAAIGFVDRCVDFTRQIMREINMEYITEFHTPVENSTKPHVWENGCLYMVRSCFLNFSSVGMEFRGRLADTGVLQDLLEDVKHIKHLTAKALECNNVCLLSMGTLHNCSQNPVVVPVLQKMNTVEQLIPFLDKGDKSLPRAIALLILAYLAEPHQMDVLELNPDSLQYYLDLVNGALFCKKEDYDGWVTAEVLAGLAMLARNDFNKRLIVAKGPMRTLLTIFQSPTRSEEEKESVLKIIDQLARNQPNVELFQRDRELMKAVRKLQDSENQTIRENAASVLSLISNHITDPDHNPNSKLLEEFLADSMNALAILDIGEVEYVLEQLRLVGKGNNSATAAVSASDLMRVLGDMSKDEGNRREILARGTFKIAQVTEMISLCALFCSFGGSGILAFKKYGSLTGSLFLAALSTLAALGQVAMIVLSFITVGLSQNEVYERNVMGCRNKENLIWRNLPINYQRYRISHHTTLLCQPNWALYIAAVGAALSVVGCILMWIESAKVCKTVNGIRYRQLREKRDVHENERSPTDFIISPPARGRPPPMRNAPPSYGYNPEPNYQRGPPMYRGPAPSVSEMSSQSGSAFVSREIDL